MFTKEEIKKLWDNLDLGVSFKGGEIYPVDLILISIYTGIRSTELLALENKDIHLDEHYIKIIFGKTENRIVPIHNDIYPLVEKRKKTGGESFANLTMAQYVSAFRLIMEQLGMSHSIYENRQTFLENNRRELKNPD